MGIGYFLLKSWLLLQTPYAIECDLYYTLALVIFPSMQYQTRVSSAYWRLLQLPRVGLAH